MVSPVSSHKCAICDKEADKKCSKCRQIFYCSVKCQRQDWQKHKQICATVQSGSAAAPVAQRSLSAAQETFLLNKVMQNKLLPNYIITRRLHDLENRPLETLVALQNTPDRINMWLTVFAFPNNDQYFDGFANLPSVKILEREASFNLLNPHDCSWFVFGKENWYQQSRNKNERQFLKCLFGPHQSALSFLQKKGYAQTTVPRVGNIVVYATNVYGVPPIFHDQFKVAHYGKVVRILEDGSIIVHSKFGHGHVYEHCLEMIPYYLGNAYTFLAKTNPTAE